MVRPGESSCVDDSSVLLRGGVSWPFAPSMILVSGRGELGYNARVPVLFYYHFRPKTNYRVKHFLGAGRGRKVCVLRTEMEEKEKEKENSNDGIDRWVMG